MSKRIALLAAWMSAGVAGLFVGCLGDGTSSVCQGGSHLCPCVAGQCTLGLACINGICLTPGSGETTGNPGDGDPDTIGDGDGDGDTKGDGDGDGDPSGDGDGDGDPSGDGDGDGDPSGDGDGDPNCPSGVFGCPCDNGQCDPGLTCINGTCMLGGGDGDGDGDIDPYDPTTCMPPSEGVQIQGIAGEMCSPPCVVNADCPAGPIGTSATCALTLNMGAADHCALVCDPLQNACPPGASCKQVPNQPGVGLCTYP